MVGKVCGAVRFGIICSRRIEDAEVNEGQPPDFSTLPTLPIRGHLVRADVLRRAKERKNQLTLEIARTRIALWETTIEGGVLAGLVKYYSKT